MACLMRACSVQISICMHINSSCICPAGPTTAAYIQPQSLSEQCSAPHESQLSRSPRQHRHHVAASWLRPPSHAHKPAWGALTYWPRAAAPAEPHKRGSAGNCLLRSCYTVHRENRCVNITTRLASCSREPSCLLTLSCLSSPGMLVIDCMIIEPSTHFTCQHISSM